MKPGNLSLACAAACGLFTAVNPAFAQGTAFTYQGRLNTNGSPANGTYSLTFSLFTASAGGTAVAGPVTNTGVTIADGLFGATIDFGYSVWNGTTNWLQIGVTTNGATNFTPVMPRQQMTPAPYAVFAESASNLNGTLPAGALAGTYSSPLTLNNASNSFTGNGAGLANVNALTLDGFGFCNLPCYWNLTGNAGTTAGVNFLGTTDNQPLELHVNAQRGLRLEPNASGAPNVIGGARLNFADPGTVGATIGGGGAITYLGLSYTNEVAANFGVIGGGYGNQIQTNSPGATIGGGSFNMVSGTNSVIAGGSSNFVASSGEFIGGGLQNSINSGLQQIAGIGSTIGGGVNNTIGDGFPSSPPADQAGQNSVGGGGGNVIEGGGAELANTIAGGQSNHIHGGASGAFANTIGGGAQNLMGYVDILAFGHVISGGVGNVIQGGESDGYCTIAGGYSNIVGDTFSTFQGCTVGGGENNSADGYGSTVAGGTSNSILGFFYQAGSAIGGGNGNFINEAMYATISGGQSNSIDRSGGASIGGGSQNIIPVNAGSSTIGGGYQNQIQPWAALSTIGGGYQNHIQSNALYAAIGGGYFNMASGTNSAIAGGCSNFVASANSVVGGGAQNSVLGSVLLRTNDLYGGNGSTIAGGFQNSIFAGGDPVESFGQLNTIGGGGSNSIEGFDLLAYGDTIAGGVRNGIGPDNTGADTIGGGDQNSIGRDSGECTIGGGLLNIVFGGQGNTIAGGTRNSVGVDASGGAICGGAQNSIGNYTEAAFVGGGSGNVIDTNGLFATIDGGFDNTNGGQYAAIAGGSYNFAGGNSSFAAGHRAKASRTGAFVWADSTDLDYDPYSYAVPGGNTNSFNVRATGGVFFVTAVNASTGQPTAGEYLTAGGSGWNNYSDRNAKTNFAGVDGRDILNRLAAVPILSWNYKTQDPAVRHVGPMAQDFNAAFGVGDADKAGEKKFINSLDIDGVALAAIQGLNRKLEEKDAEIQQLKLQNETFEKRLANLEKLAKLPANN
jgi:trimeric autotransporter adhesin